MHRIGLLKPLQRACIGAWNGHRLPKLCWLSLEQNLRIAGPELQHVFLYTCSRSGSAHRRLAVPQPHVLSKSGKPPCQLLSRTDLILVFGQASADSFAHNTHLYHS